MSGTVRRMQDFSDIDNLDRATEAFLREQRKALEERRFVRAPRTAPLWIQSHWKQAIVTAALVLVGGIAVFAGVKLTANGRSMRAPEPETTQAAEVIVTSEKQTETEQTESEQQTEQQEDSETKGSKAATTAPRPVEKTTAEERTVSSNASSATTRRTEASSGSQSSSETLRSAESQKEKPATTTASQRGSSGVKVIVSNATTRTTPTMTSRQTTTTTTTTRATTAPKATTSRQTTVSTAQTTPQITDAPKATPVVNSVKISDVKRQNGGYQHRITIEISNPSSVRFNDTRTFYVRLGNAAIKSGCVSGSATMNQTTGSTLSFYYGGPLASGGKVSIVLLVVTERPMASASCTLG